MYERESIFFLNLCLPLFGRLGSRCCPVFSLQYYRCHWKVWAGDRPWSPFPCWALAECLTRLSKPKRGWALSKGVCRVGQPPVYFENFSWPPEQLLEPLACPLFPLFQAISCRALGFSVLQADYAATVLDFILCSQFPLYCCFSCTVKTSLHFSVPLWVLVLS